MTSTDLASIAFTTSSPATRGASGNSAGQWRVAHADRLQATLRALPGVDADVYVDSWPNATRGQRRLWVSYRDNRDAAAHSTRLLALRDTMRAGGLSVRVGKLGGCVAYLVVTDKC